MPPRTPLALVVLLLGGCQPAPTAVGTVTGLGSTVGLSFAGDQAVMYVAGGLADLERHHHWFELERTAAGWHGQTDHLEVHLDGGPEGGLGEIIDVDTEELTPFRISPGEPGDGPWRAERPVAGCQTGGVVRARGTVMRGVHFCSEGPVVDQLLPIGTFAPTSGRIEVGGLQSPDLRFTMVPAEPEG